jgi:GNAT superfamily N-acetyltransferase
MTVALRPITRADAEAIVGMSLEFGAYLKSLSDTWEPNFTVARYLEDGFGADPAFGGIIAEESGQPLGYLLHAPTYDVDLACRVLFIIDLWVRPFTRRLGVGRKLMEAAAEAAREQNAGYLLWTVYKPNTMARGFYDGIGGNPVEDLDWMTLKV